MKYVVTIAALAVACNSSQNTAPTKPEPTIASAKPEPEPPPAPVPTPAPTSLAPAPAGKNAAITMMLAGDAGALPLRATDPGKSFDARARDSIAPRDHAKERPRVVPDPFAHPL